MSEDTPIPFPAREDVQEDLRDLFRGAIRFTLESFLEQELVEMIGADRQAIAKAEGRKEFREAMENIGLEMPRSRLAYGMEEALSVLDEIR